MGLGALVSFALVGFLDWHLLVYLLVFFLLSDSIVASMMAAIGSAPKRVSSTIAALCARKMGIAS